MSDFGGLNPHHAVAGLGGGLASLPFLKPATKLAVLGSVVAGIVTAMYMTPAVAEFLASPKVMGSPLTETSKLGLAFLLGLTAMIFIPAVLGAATWIKDNIAAIMQKLTNTTPKEPPQ